jgi:hypothetical protein
VLPTVSATTPTLNRPETHQALYEGFAADRYPSKELVVLDESARPSPFFSALRDPRVRYVHEPGKPREGGVTRIGAARNRLTALARGEIIQCRDDDDVYAPEFLTEMVQRLKDADLVKLAVWRCSHGPYLFEWDTRKFGGQHWAIRGAERTLTWVDPKEGGPDGGPAIADAFLVGFGWSYCFWKSLAERFPFPEEGTEDIPWVRTIRAAGAKIKLLEDCAHLALHTIHIDPNHAQGGSPHFPQRLLGAAGARQLQDAVRSRMLADMGRELPSGQAIRIEPGIVYTILASLKRSTSLKALASRADQWGVKIETARDDVPVAEFNTTEPAGDYRLVLVQGSSPVAITLPWKVPAPLNVFDKSSIVRAWTNATGASMARESGLHIFEGCFGDPEKPWPNARLGAGATLPPGFSTFLQGEPAPVAASWADVQSQFTAEGNPDIYDAATDFQSAYQQIGFATAQVDPGTIASSAAQYVLMGRTAIGALAGVGGLLGAAASGTLTPQAAQQFTGMLVSGATSIAVGSGIVTAGVGAAIVAGIALLESVIDQFIPNVVAQVGNCGLPSKPQIVVGTMWSYDAPSNPAGPSSPYWRKFPNPQSSDDAQWFSQPSPEHIYWSSGQQQFNWYICNTATGTDPLPQRFIDYAWPIYRQLECEASAGAAAANLQIPSTPTPGGPYTQAQIAFAQFQASFFAAWKANQEYALNGLTVQLDYQVLLQTLRFWNNSHSNAQTMQLQARAGSPMASAVSTAQGPQLAPCASPMIPYEAMLVEQVGSNASSDPNYDASTQSLVINIGPSLAPVIASQTAAKLLGSLPVGGVPQLPGLLTGGGKKTMTSTSKALLWTGGAAVVGFGLYAWLTHQGISEAFQSLVKKAGAETAKSGSLLAGAHVPLLAAERRSKKYERCVRAVKRKGGGNPFAICRAATRR